MLQSQNPTIPFNKVQGVASTNVHAYSNGDDDFFSVERHYLHGIFMGFKWQCVEFARRWLLMRKSCIFPAIPCAADMWDDLKYVERVTDGKRFPLKLYRNGSPHKPKHDSLLIYPRSTELPFGHVAIICDVVPDSIRIAEQNYIYHSWSDNYAREISLAIKDNCYFMTDEDEIIGWIEIDDNDELQPLDETKLDLILKQYQEAKPIGTLERCSITDKSFHSINNWLDESDPAEQYFIKLYGPELIRADTDTLPYYKVDQELTLSIGSTSNELHQMFMDATNYVMENDDILKHFCIPEVFWSRIRQSWLNEKDITMMGRFDLAFDGQQLKTFEYNADSASALFEMAIIQEKWAQAVKLDHTFMSGFQLHRLLIKSWKKICTNLNIKCVHLLIDDDQDEILTALYMKYVLKETNIESKLCILYNDLYWKDSKIIDKDGSEVRLVWKTWMWESVFSDYLQAEKDEKLNKKINGEHPRLCEILLNDDIQVIEPLWKVIPSNKAILPVLWSMFPNHPHLLRSEWTLTDDLKQGGYVKKPIVGRCGHNVTLYDVNGGSVLDETQGKFIDRNSIYQKLFPLPKHDGYYAIFGSWIIHGLFAGFGIREDKKLITDADSPVTACSIKWK
jgi:trypanothione synthetase/amidase